MHQTVDYLIEGVNVLLMKPNSESIRNGVLDNMRDCIRLIGVGLVCEPVKEEIEIKEGRYRFPEKMIAYLSFIPEQKSKFQVKMDGHEMSSKVNNMGYRYQFHKTPFELIFPNIKEGSGTLSYYSLYEEEDINGIKSIMIPDTIFSACKHWCEWKMLSNSNNPKNPRWIERAQMRADAYVAINEARGNINETNRFSFR